MNTMAVFMMGQINKGNEQKVFDWEKAAELIKIKNPQKVYAGLDEDWSCTAGVIFEDGKMKDDGYAYLSSTWATPVIGMDGERVICYKMKSKTPGWDCSTIWPEVAKRILQE